LTRDRIKLAIVASSHCLKWNILYGLQKITESPAFRKQQAGWDAERYVRQLITDGQCHFPHSLALHGTLFVFQADTSDEFSVEADHLLVTTRTIFVIETKYKSGANHGQGRFTHMDGERAAQVPALTGLRILKGSSIMRSKSYVLYKTSSHRKEICPSHATPRWQQGEQGGVDREPG
jgi:hypothetical protein